MVITPGQLFEQCRKTNHDQSHSLHTWEKFSSFRVRDWTLIFIPTQRTRLYRSGKSHNVLTPQGVNIQDRVCVSVHWLLPFCLFWARDWTFILILTQSSRLYKSGESHYVSTSQRSASRTVSAFQYIDQILRSGRVLDIVFHWFSIRSLVEVHNPPPRNIFV